MKKRFVGIFVLICIVLGMVCSFPAAAFAAADGTWQAVAETEIFADKNQMEYVIETPEQLAGFAYMVNTMQDSFMYKTVKLAQNIDLQGRDWVPIDHSGSKTGAGFWGTFDGNGKEISNMTITKAYEEVGFFGHSDGTIKNVKLTGIDIKITSGVVKYVGGVCGGLITTSRNIKGRVENCTVDGRIVARTEYLNAVVGYVYPGAEERGNTGNLKLLSKWSEVADTSIFEDPNQSTYEIYTAEQLAGFAAKLNEGTDFAGKTVKLMASLDIFGLEWVPGGGFQGTFDGRGNAIVGMEIDSADGDVGFFSNSGGAIKNLSISGDVTTIKDGYCAGILSGVSSAEITSCYTYGSVKNEWTDFAVGGLVGKYTGSKMQDCVNAATVRGVNDSYYLDPDVGGLIGRWDVEMTPPLVLLESCSNLGNIYFYNGFVGGLVGRLNLVGGSGFNQDQDIVIENCAVPYGVVMQGKNYGTGKVGALISRSQFNLREPVDKGTTRLHIVNSYGAPTVSKAMQLEYALDLYGSGGSPFNNISLDITNTYIYPNVSDVAHKYYGPIKSGEIAGMKVSALENYLMSVDGGKIPTATELAAYKKESYLYYPDRDMFSTLDDPSREVSQDQTFTMNARSFLLNENLPVSGIPKLSGWASDPGKNNGYPYLTDGKLDAFRNKVYALGSTVVSGDARASLENTPCAPYGALDQQLQADKDTGFLMRVERGFFNPSNAPYTPVEKIKFGSKLPKGTTATLRKIKADFSGYDGGLYIYQVRDGDTTEIALTDFKDGGNTPALPSTDKNAAYDVFFTFENAVDFTEYKTTYSVLIDGQTALGTGTADEITVQKIGKANVTFTYQEEDGSVAYPGGNEIPSGTAVRVLVGSDQQFLIQPELGYTAEVKVDDVDVAVPLTGGLLDLKGIKGDTDVAVTFNRQMYTITLDTQSAGARTDPQTPAQAGYGEDFSFKVFAQPGYEKQSEIEVQANGTAVSPNADGVYTLSNVTQKMNLTITGFGVDTTPPTVASVSGTGAAAGGEIEIGFGEVMNKTAGTVQLSDLPALGAGRWSSDGKTYFAPYADLAGNTQYMVHIDGFKDFAGNLMTKDSSHTFQTEMASPDVSLVITPDTAQAFPNPITLTAAISGTHAVTGTVTFYTNVPDADGNMVETDISGEVPVTGNAAAYTYAPPGAEEYTYWAKYSGDASNNAADSPSLSYTISKGMGIITLSDISKVYDGAAVAAPDITASSTGAATIEYLVDGSYTGSAPADAGSYVVRVRVAADENYNEAMVSQPFEITQAEPVYTAPSYFLVIEGTKLGDIDLSSYHANGTFEWKTPEADVGAVGSTAQHELIFLPDTKNYKRAEGIMATVEVRRKPIIPEAQSSVISGISGSYTVGDTITFTATGSGMDNTAPLEGDTRWKPASWKCNPEGVFAEGEYSASFVLEKAGNYELSITFEEEAYDGTGFVATGNAYAQTTPILVNEAYVPPAKEQPAEEPKVKKAAATSDNAPIFTYSLLALFSAAVLAAAMAKKKKSE